ncbi:hypothetical protein AYO20_11206 [Fonsecaea nubica]|uniref:Uncharacterized protein n=1 Tax=Fonsecaea nubica TaxID=856822 RepID=A0A178C0V2_9EURO|nr:hypothetical protein AYO20_11206 [Fonsecaea nubica]OAL22381.1 hypothetical protein AYO20_11206 [Fonsecaea nubica]
MSSSFPGVAVVIWAGSGDGRAVAHLLVQSGCTKLVLGGLDEGRLAEVVKECHALTQGHADLQILSRKCDSREPRDVDELIAAAVARFGQIDYCANCERPDGFYGETTEAPWATFTTAGERWQRGVWLAMRAEVRQFLAQKANRQSSAASIVNVSAAHGLASDPGFPSYSAAAHGVVGMSRATALDHLSDGIRINCVCPGPSAPQTLPEKTPDGNAPRRSLPLGPLGREITPDEVARAVVFLLGEASSAITGIELPVDGGWSLRHH